MKKILRSFLSFLICLFAMQSFSVAQSSPPDLPEACLPWRVDRDADPADHSTCHCPPKQLCDQAVSFQGSQSNKLPSFLQLQCCTITMPPPPSPPSGSPPSYPNSPPDVDPIPPAPPPYTDYTGNTCDVAYITASASECPDFSTLAPRAVEYCLQYHTDSTNIAYRTSIYNLNNLLAQCKTDHLDAGNFDTSGISTLEDLMNNSILKSRNFNNSSGKYNTTTINNYINCRNQAFATSGLNSLKSDAENQVSLWLLSSIGGGLSVDSWTNLSAKIASYSEGLETTDGSVVMTFDIDNVNHYNFINSITLAPFWPHTLDPIGQDTTVSLAEGTVNGSRRGGGSDPNIEIRNIIGPTTSSQNDTGFSTSIASTGNSSGSVPNEYFVNTNAPDADTTTCSLRLSVNVCLAMKTHSGSCRDCLSPDTQIIMSDGTSSPIKTLKAGDMIKTPYGSKQAKVLKNIKITWPELVLYNINQGKLKLTADHPVMTKKGGWKAVNYNSRGDQMGFKRYGIIEIPKLEIGDVIIMQDGAEMEVTHILPETPIKDGVTYNLQLEEGASSFYANGILVKSHN